MFLFRYRPFDFQNVSEKETQKEDFILDIVSREDISSEDIPLVTHLSNFPQGWFFSTKYLFSPFPKNGDGITRLRVSQTIETDDRRKEFNDLLLQFAHKYGRDKTFQLLQNLEHHLN